jgi:hypothetical protein
MYLFMDSSNVSLSGDQPVELDWSDSLQREKGRKNISLTSDIMY